MSILSLYLFFLFHRDHNRLTFEILLAALLVCLLPKIKSEREQSMDTIRKFLCTTLQSLSCLWLVCYTFFLLLGLLRVVADVVRHQKPVFVSQIPVAANSNPHASFKEAKEQ